MLARLLIAQLFLLSFCFAQEQPPGPDHRAISTIQIHGFRGHIQSSKYVIHYLQEDPRLPPKLPVRFVHKGWMLFDSSGQLKEEGDLDAAGHVHLLVRRSYNSNGEESASEIIDGEKITRYRLETNKASDGTVERRTFLNDNLQSTIVTRVNGTSTAGETKVTGADGKVISYTRSQRSASTQTVESWGKDGKFVINSRRSVDDDGNTTETSRFDETGKLVSTMSFNQGELTSFWRDPGCHCTNAAGFRTADGSTVFYTIDKDGKLYKEVQHHPGCLTNHEIDDDELYDQNGALLERIAYKYVRDEHGNWTKRTVSVLDPKTNRMVAIQEDTRELSYF